MANIAIIHDNPSPTASDLELQSVLQAAGHTVTMEVESPTVAVTGYDAVVISESGSSTAVDPYVNSTFGVVCWETAWATLLMSSVGATSPGSSSTDWDLVGTHAINDGHADPLTVYSAGQATYGVDQSTLPAGVETLALHPSSTHALVIAADTGAALTSGNAAGRRVCMGLISDRFSGFTAAGDAYVVSAVEWAAGVGGAASGEATGSWSVSATAVGNNAPGVPTGLAATPVSGSQIDLSWNAVTGASGYDIERDGAVIVYDHATTTYSDIGLDPNTTYDYRVRAVE